MRMLNLDFSIIGVTETWLNDVTCDLYGMGGYELIEKHWTNKGGGVLVSLWRMVSITDLVLI